MAISDILFSREVITTEIDFGGLFSVSDILTEKQFLLISEIDQKTLNPANDVLYKNYDPITERQDYGNNIAF